MKPEFIVLTIFYMVLMSMYIHSGHRWEKEREMLLRMAEVERQRLLDRIQARDLPEYKAVQPVSTPTPKEPCPEKDELIPL